MAITILNNQTKQKRAEAKYSSFEELKKQATVVKEPSSKPAPKPATKPAQRAPVSFNEKPSTINNNIIKPKYIQDSSVVYKKSGYIKDLLGEGK